MLGTQLHINVILLMKKATIATVTEVVVSSKLLISIIHKLMVQEANTRLIHNNLSMPKFHLIFQILSLLNLVRETKILRCKEMIQDI